MPERIEVQCKEPNCDEAVVYERDVVRGFRPTRDDSKKVSVYLTCSDDHTHKYEFEKQS